MKKGVQGAVATILNNWYGPGTDWRRWWRAPLQYSCLENPMDRGAWWVAVHGVVKSRTQLSDFTFTFHFPALEKEMATHFSVLAWKIPGMGEPGGLVSMGSHRVRHDWNDLAAAAAGRLQPPVSLVQRLTCARFATVLGEVTAAWVGNRLRLFLDIHPNLPSRHVAKGCWAAQ